MPAATARRTAVRASPAGGRCAPVPRARIYDLYWRFAAERLAILERRLAGQPPPWTTDPVLLEYKFCNTYRAADRVSQYMIRDVCYHDEACSPADRLFQITAFRTFSLPATWRTVRDVIGRYPLIADLADGSLTRALETARARNGRLYTSAFILCPTRAYGHAAKHLNHIAMLEHMFLRGDLASRLLDAPALRDVYELLRGYPLMGDFMAYQTAVDLNYQDLLGFGENDFTQPGPGALRGLRKVFHDPGGYTPAELIYWMTERQDLEFARLGLPFAGLWGRPLHAIDVQGLFCETDKYCRVAAPELASPRSQIKSRFTPSSEPLTLFFPPMWGINDKIAPGAALRPGAAGGQQLLF
jgi:hypothetical protein